MKAFEFCYWLQGFFELRDGAAGATPISAEQAGTIRAHLALVFKHEIDPSYSANPATQAAMQAIHDKPKKRPPGGHHDLPGGGGTVYRC